jgi:hypothetical protein
MLPTARSVPLSVKVPSVVYPKVVPWIAVIATSLEIRRPEWRSLMCFNEVYTA